MTLADAVDGVVPARIEHPANVETLRDLIRQTDAQGLAVVVSGLGRHLGIGAPPRRLDVLVCLDRLDRVVAHQAADMTVTVEAGCTLAALDAVLAPAGQWLPLDPPAPEATTIGGLVAANLAGPLRASQGTARDLLLGLRWIAPDGAVLAGGGRVVKNVAGYDLPKMHVGALGTLGVVVEATFKVRPRPPCERALLLACDSPQSAVETALRVRDTVEPTWLELATADVVPEAGAGYAVIAGFAGLTEEVDAAEARVRSAHASLPRLASRRDDAEASALRAALAAASLTTCAAVLRAATLPTALGDFLARASHELAEVREPVRCVAHAANGIARLLVSDPARVRSLVGALRPVLEASGGFLVVERAVPEVKRMLGNASEVWGDCGPARELMRRLKLAFDPRNTFAPGRFVAEI